MATESKIMYFPEENRRYFPSEKSLFEQNCIKTNTKFSVQIAHASQFDESIAQMHSITRISIPNFGKKHIQCGMCKSWVFR